MSIDDIMKETGKDRFPSDFYKIQEGSNRMRILSDFVKVETMQENKTYKGIFKGTDIQARNWILEGEDDSGKTNRRINMKGWAWAIIRKPEGDDLKIVQFGRRIIGMILTFKNSADWSFDTFPMAYDIDVTAKDAGTTEVIYTVMPSKVCPVTSSEALLYEKKKPVEAVVEAIYSKQTGEKPATTGQAAYTGTSYPSPKDEGIDPEQIPF